MRTVVFGVMLSATLAAQAVPSLQFRGGAASKHAMISAAPTDLMGAPGAKVMLFVDVAPNPKIHVYAPGSKDYIPITVDIAATPDVKAGKLAYPKSDTMVFGDEKVQVFQKPFRLTQEVTLGKGLKAGTTAKIAGTVHLQACDDSVCFPPETVPVTWTVMVKEAPRTGRRGGS